MSHNISTNTHTFQAPAGKVKALFQGGISETTDFIQCKTSGGSTLFNVTKDGNATANGLLTANGGFNTGATISTTGFTANGSTNVTSITNCKITNYRTASATFDPSVSSGSPTTLMPIFDSTGRQIGYVPVFGLIGAPIQMCGAVDPSDPPSGIAVTTVDPHGLSGGAPVTLYGTTAYDGGWTVTSILSANVFYANATYTVDTFGGSWTTP